MLATTRLTLNKAVYGFTPNNIAALLSRITHVLRLKLLVSRVLLLVAIDLAVIIIKRHYNNKHKLIFLKERD